MSHPLTGTRGYPIGKPWAAVKAERRGDEFHLVSGEGLVILKVDALVAPLPTEFIVFDPDGQPVLPTRGRRFVISTETIDPFHLIAEVS